MSQTDSNPMGLAPHVPHVAGEGTHLRRLVVLGASAGGLDALSRVFDHVPPASGASFVVIQHLSSDHPTMMDTLLSRHTSMPVTIAQQGERLQPDHVLLIPPGKHMLLRDDCIELTEKPAHGVGLPIDEFLVSAARSVGERLVAAILSGTGSDGSRGVVQVSEWGGVVLAQSPDSSEFDGMPRSALATGVVDQMRDAPGIGHALGLLLRVGPASSGMHAAASAGGLDQAEDVVQTLASIAGAVRQYTGLDLEQYKSDMLLRRVRRRMLLVGEESLLTYADRLVGNEAEAYQLRREVLIPVTRFFRDPETFEHLAKEVLPTMLENLPTDQTLRVWIAACATGEEAYTMAMVINEVCQRMQRFPNVKVYATDVEQRFLDIAGAGLYPDPIAGEVSPERLARFFNRKGHQYQIKTELRAQVVFARHNILVDPPFTRLNLVSCRNMLIYLRQPTQEAVLNRLQFALLPQGVLILGRSESLFSVEPAFAVSDSRARVFRLTQTQKPVLPPMSGLKQDGRSRNPGASRSSTMQQMHGLALGQFLSRQYAPPALLLDERRQVLHMSGAMQPWLQWREGAPSLDLVDLLPLELSSIVVHLLNEAAESDQSVSTPPLAQRKGPVVITATRLDSPDGAQRLMVLTFDQPGLDRTPELPAVPIALAEPAREQVAHLQRELTSTRANLQTTIEELQMTNEELQATNEELMASNEELQSTNEELQSVNEELYSVNAEYQTKMHMLGTLNADLEGMSRALGIPHLFLDEDLKMLRMTSEASQLFNIRETDAGRSVEDFSHRLDYPELFADIRRTLANGVPVEREVRSEDGRWHLARLVPYQALSGHMNPERRVVATFVDTTVVHDALRLQAIIDAMPANLAVLDGEGNILSVNQGWRDFAEGNGDKGLSNTGPGKNYVAVIAKALSCQGPQEGQGLLEGAQRGLLAVLRREAPSYFQVYPCHSPDEQRWFAMHVTQLKIQGGGALVAHYDVTGWARPESEARA
jgi:two-component system CheB/CheR fusion protein